VTLGSEGLHLPPRDDPDASGRKARNPLLDRTIRRLKNTKTNGAKHRFDNPYQPFFCDESSYLQAQTCKRSPPPLWRTCSAVAPKKMSSFVGHALTAGAIFVSRRNPKLDFSPRGFCWLGCLLAAAVAPDLDYFLPFLKQSQHGGIRISNSFAYSLLVPAVVCLGLLIARTPPGVFRVRSIQITLAGVSHILLDYLVGVHPSPLFWPISTEVYTCPVGILPSAGALDVRNPYLYRNLGIELGILVPFFSAVALMIWRVPSAIGVRIFWVSILLGVSLCFTVLSMGLNR
jgi:inner membrane protein